MVLGLNARNLIGRCFFCFVLLFTGSGGLAVSNQEYYLAPCPASPNCVSSDEPATSSKYVEPIISAGTGGRAGDRSSAQRLLDAIAAYLSEQPEYELLHRSNEQLRAKATTRLLRFVDDLEFRVREGSVVVRSASRVGYSDLGKNRRRIEALRDAMVRQGLAMPSAESR